MDLCSGEVGRQLIRKHVRFAVLAQRLAARSQFIGRHFDLEHRGGVPTGS